MGKSRLAVALAQTAGGEIVSADSMQIYRGLAVLTDQPSPEMLAAVPHHMIAVAPLSEEYSAGRFAREAGGALEQVAAAGHLPIVAGGTGLYNRALLGGLALAGEPSAAARKKWERFIQENSESAAAAQLEQMDPEAAAVIDVKNPRRLVRALAAAESGGASMAAERDRLWDAASSPYRVISFGLEMPREQLYARIDARVEEMLAGGAIEEVRQALEGEVSRTAAQAIGFAEIGMFLSGETSIDEAKAAIRQKSRRYAKRQLTWMRKMPDIVRIDLAEEAFTAALGQIIDRLERAGFIP